MDPLRNIQVNFPANGSYENGSPYFAAGSADGKTQSCLATKRETQECCMVFSLLRCELWMDNDINHTDACDQQALMWVPLSCWTPLEI